MDIVKNNIVSIILGVIALVALTTPLWLVGGYAEELQANAEESRKVASQLEGLLNKPRTKPAPTPEGQAQPLERFPNEPTIRAGEALRDDVATTASQMLNTAVEINRQNREPLVDDALPQPRNNGNFRFRDAYNDQAKSTRIIRDRLQGGIPPTADEIKAEQERVWTQNFQPRIRGAAGSGQTNQAQVQADFQVEAVKIPGRMTLETAQKIKMYVDPNALTWHPAILPGGPAPTAEQIWYAQLGLWMQEAVAEAMAATNADAVDVRDAVVKHLLRIEFADNPYVMPVAQANSSSSTNYEVYDELSASGGAGGAGAATGVPTVMPDPTQPLPRQYNVSITGRVSNALFDVTSMRVTAIVDATRVPQLLLELGDERFLYVRQMRMQSVDAVGQQLAGYIYGKEPVVQLTMDIEMLFMRGWTMPLMPDRVRIALGIPPVSAVPTAGNGDVVP